jgi:hypothetical protein
MFVPEPRRNDISLVSERFWRMRRISSHPAAVRRRHRDVLARKWNLLMSEDTEPPEGVAAAHYDLIKKCR